MTAQKEARLNPRMQVVDFIIHLRWHYQVFILSGCYLLGGLFYAGAPDWGMFLLQFLNVHLLLFGGATAFNSYWDKDTGRIGGLKHPPIMSGWMHQASLALQFFGLMLAFLLGLPFTTVYLASMLMFWLYSTPLAKWKGRPWLSMVAIGISTGACSFLMGFIALGGSPGAFLVIPAAGCSLILLSLYPVSQIFQMEEDRERNYQTFAIQYGLKGIKTFFVLSYYPGMLIISYSLREDNLFLGLVFLFVAALAGSVIWFQLKKIKGTEADYDKVMRLKYLTSFAFVAFITLCLLVG
ncbi:MAG: UbiA family prenyltransferase [Balneolales bacterium]